MAGLGKASAVVATGTLVSRITGLIRNVVLAAALPPVMNQAADAFAIANQLPNNIYAVISSGLLAGVIVPQIVKAARSKDGGSAFVSKLLTLGVMVMLAVTVVAVVAAPILVFAYGSQMNDPKAFALTIAFAYWCLPQLLFYGMYALVGEVLNARRVFGPYAWSPIVNNIVSIVGFLAFICVFGAQTDAVGWTPEMIAALGATATGGIVAQAVVLFFFWRKTGMHVRPDFRWRGIGLRHIGRLAGWTFLMVIVGQLAGLLQSNLLSSASGEGASIATTQYAWLVFMLPFSVIVLSIGTPYYTQLSEHAAEGRTDAIRGDLDRLTRTVCLFVVGVLAAIVAAILPISRIFSPDAASAVPFAFVLGAYLVALLPLSVQFGIQRTFYAYQDTRTPFLFTAVQAGLVVASAIVAFLLLPVQYLAVGVALGQSLANIVQLSLAIWLLRRKIGPLGLGGAVISLLRFLAAAVPAAAVGWWVYTLVASGVMVEKLNAVVGAALVGGVSLAVYVLALIVLRAPELRVAGRMLRRFLPGGR